MAAGTLDGVIEQMCDDELGIISPVRVYVCDDQQHAVARSASSLMPSSLLPYTARPVTVRDVDDEVVCVRCGYGPVLWDHWRQQTYVLTPYVIIEEEF